MEASKRQLDFVILLFAYELNQTDQTWEKILREACRRCSENFGLHPDHKVARLVSLSKAWHFLLLVGSLLTIKLPICNQDYIESIIRKHDMLQCELRFHQEMPIYIQLWRDQLQCHCNTEQRRSKVNECGCSRTVQSDTRPYSAQYSHVINNFLFLKLVFIFQFNFTVSGSQ